MGVQLADLLNIYDLQLMESEENIELLPGSLNKQSGNFLYWLKSAKYYSMFTEGYILLKEEDYSSAKSQKGLNPKLKHLIVRDHTPRFVFGSILSTWFSAREIQIENCVHEHFSRTDIQIGDNVYIGADVTIGAGTIIYPGAVIHNGVRIGENCEIREHTSIGTAGLGFERINGELHKFPQIGGLIIEDEVLIGAHSSIKRGALDDTILRRGSKLGSYINIGHNCDIGENAMFTCQCVVSGSSVVGSGLFMGVGATIRNGVQLGSDVTIGQGAVVVKNFGDGITLVGNPAKPLKK